MSAGTLRALMAAGLTGEELCGVVDKIDQDMALQMPSKDSAAERRRAYDRDRKRNSTGNSAEVKSPISTGIPPEIPPENAPSRVRDNPLSSISTGKKEKKEPNGSSTRPTRKCPPEWIPGESVLGVASMLTAGEIEREIAKFRDHTFTTARTDWDATARNWLRRADETKGPIEINGHSRPAPTPADIKQSERHDNLARALNAPSVVPRSEWAGR